MESVTENILEGGKIVLSHGNGLYTVYASVDAASGLRAGDTVEQGEVIGTVSAAADAMGNEFNEGAHLHFEVLENEKQIDPATYLDYEENNGRSGAAAAGSSCGGFSCVAPAGISVPARSPPVCGGHIRSGAFRLPYAAGRVFCAAGGTAVRKVYKTAQIC